MYTFLVFLFVLFGLFLFLLALLFVCLLACLLLFFSGVSLDTFLSEEESTLIYL